MVHFDLQANEEHTSDARVGNKDNHDGVEDVLVGVVHSDDEILSFQVRLNGVKDALLLLTIYNLLSLLVFFFKLVTILTPDILFKRFDTLFAFIDHSSDELYTVEKLCPSLDFGVHLLLSDLLLLMFRWLAQTTLVS